MSASLLETTWREAVLRTRVLVVVPTVRTTHGAGPGQRCDRRFRAYRADILACIDLDRVRADGYGFPVEMAYQVHSHGGRIAEVPIEFRDRTRGRSKVSARIGVEALWLVTRWGVRDRLRRTRPRSAVVAPAR
jgi:hypothetical protein